MTNIPRETTIDASPSLLREGYTFISTRCARHGTDVFQTRIMGRTAYCLTGAEAAEIFFEPDRMTRRGALPRSTLRLLQDEGSVATLDGSSHRRRKAMFLELLSRKHSEELATLAAEELRQTAQIWALKQSVRLHDEFRDILGRVIIRWSGVDLDDQEQDRLIDELGAMIDNAGSLGPPNWIARARRLHSERLLRRQIDRTRAGFLHPREDSPLFVISWHRDERGHLLEPDVCTVELLNILRPTVAVSRFLAFAVDALGKHPVDLSRLAKDRDYARSFVQEVRRFYPFFPFVAGIARKPFSWRDHDFVAGDFFLLDIYGTNRDPAVYDRPEAFLPERFLGRDPTAFDLIPQGGGSHGDNHRCAGEWATIALMIAMLQTFVGDVRCRPLLEDRIDRSVLPATPKHGFPAKVVQRH
ncbi:cytochrome P450 [Aurantimonas sp. HBX-1]|uniref:cytochrome P450 n=1 Tax=Aurantimonas sp. HBX-1 TaxID=2906072 RepID=UPI001F1B8AFB|nr:cytochrome P450 [Aurantimonas sp. HBX-1]UIJ73334.1 cytochrome P450 [Aurantimonas sp. HBX-1]